MTKRSPLADMLAIAVPLRILMLQARGGPGDIDREIAQIYAESGLEHADEMLFGMAEKGEVAAWFNDLAQSIAVLAFWPGGVSMFGVHYETDAQATGATE